MLTGRFLRRLVPGPGLTASLATVTGRSGGTVFSVWRTAEFADWPVVVLSDSHPPDGNRQLKRAADRTAPPVRATSRSRSLSR